MHFGVAVGGLGCAKAALGDGAGRRQQALDAPSRPSRCFTRATYRAAPAQAPAHTAAPKQVRTATAALQLCCPWRQLQVSRAVARPTAGLAWDGHFDG